MLIWYKVMHKFSYEHNTEQIGQIKEYYILGKNLSGA